MNSEFEQEVRRAWSVPGADFCESDQWDGINQPHHPHGRAGVSAYRDLCYRPKT